MSYQQLVQPKLSTQSKAGWCLWFQEEDFGTPHAYDYAEDEDPATTDAWSLVDFKHPGEQPPDDVCVPVYFTYFSTKDGREEGHIADSVPGRGIFSSPLNVSYGSEWYPSIQAMVDRINKIRGANCRYLGWSEDLAGVRLVNQEDDVVKIEDATNWYNRCNITYRATRGRELDRDTFVSFVGKEFLTFVEYCEDDPEAATVSNWQSVGQQAVTENWQQQISDLTAELKEAQDKPAPEPQVITKTVRTPIKDYTFGEIWNGFWQKIANK